MAHQHAAHTASTWCGSETKSSSLGGRYRARQLALWPQKYAARLLWPTVVPAKEYPCSIRNLSVPKSSSPVLGHNEQPVVKGVFKEIVKIAGKAHFVPLLPRHGIYLIRLGHANDERFAYVFRETWKCIPRWGQRTILEEWRRIQARPGSTAVVPQIRVLNEWPGSVSFSKGRRGVGPPRKIICLGVCCSGGHTLRFLARAVDALPDDLLGVLIAHELAHIAFRDLELFELCDNKQDIERGTQELVLEWGFDENALDAWIHANWPLLE